MLSWVSASLGVTSPFSFSGLGGDVVAVWCPGRGGASIGWVGSPDFLSWIDFYFASGRLPEGVESLSPSTENGLVLATGASGFPAVNVGLVRRPGSIEEAGFEKNSFFFRAVDEGVI